MTSVATADRVAELEAENRELRRVLTPSDLSFDVALDLTPLEDALLRTVYGTSQPYLSTDAMMAALYGGRDPDDMPGEAILPVLKCRINQKLKRIGVRIETKRLSGSHLSATSRANLAPYVRSVARGPGGRR